MTTPPRNDGARPDNILQWLFPGDAGGVFRPDWESIQKTFPSEGLFFLKESYIREACDFIGIPRDAGDALIRSLALFRDCPFLSLLAWHCHHRLFLTADFNFRETRRWPMLPGDIHQDAPMFYASILLSGLPHVRELHANRGIPPNVTAATLADLELWMREYRRLHGRWGFSEPGWVSRHFLGKLYKLGRLQFELSQLYWGFHAFRNIKDGRLTVLAGSGMRFGSGGQFDGANGIHDPAGAWTAEFETGGGFIRGTPISPKGYALNAPIELDAGEWIEAARDGDPALAIHIDASGPMSHEACGDSIHRAMEFFPAHFPECGSRAFTCDSWLLDPQLELHLPPSSNIVRFLREFYLLPLANASGKQTFERVFDGPVENPAGVRCTTSLQRAIIEHVQNGGHWRNGGGMLFPEDMDWGKCVYRNRWGRDSVEPLMTI